MYAETQNSSTTYETLKARKAHLIELLMIIDPKPRKTTATQALPISAIKAEIGNIEKS
nr:hypothetical protein [uncultured Pseudomonas sp.]